MAIYPCDFSHHRFPQPQQSIYFTVARDDFVKTVVLRLCPAHMRAVTVLCSEQLLFIDDDGQMNDRCDSCGGDPDVLVGAKLFPAKDEMKQYASQFCAECADKATDLLLVAKGRPLPPRRNGLLG